MSALAFRNLLEAGDVAGLMAFWSNVMPSMPQARDYKSAEVVMHMARTGAESIKFALRAYSHTWLTERSLRSQLPDGLKPAAERLYPRIAATVGISVNTRSEILKPAMTEVRGAMESAVLEVDADGRLDDAVHVKARMSEAREKTLRKLFGANFGAATA